MNDLVRRVIEARRRAREAERILAEIEADFRERNAAIYAAARAAIHAEVNAVNDLREAAMAEFKSTGDKHPAPGVQVKIIRTVRYEDRDARQWAQSFAPAFLKLDARRLETHLLKADARGLPLPGFASVTRVPRAEIKGDLEAAQAGPVHRATADEMTPEAIR